MNAKFAFDQLHRHLAPLYGDAEAASIAAIVLEDAFGLKRPQITDQQQLTEPEAERLALILARLLTHEPVQYVLGETQFFGLKFKVGPAVLIPRQETEELVAWVLDTLPPRARVLDIGTGSGCIPVALKKRRPDLEMHALDVSAEALALARENAAHHATEVHFHHLDILEEKNWEALPLLDCVVSNPPYITAAEEHYMPPHVLDYEPHLALFTTDGDAQQFVKKIAALAPRKLRPGGWLFFETNEFFAPDSQEVMAENGFEEITLRQDLNGKDRMLRGRWPG